MPRAPNALRILNVSTWKPVQPADVNLASRLSVMMKPTVKILMSVPRISTTAEKILFV